MEGREPVGFFGGVGPDFKKVDSNYENGNLNNKGKQNKDDDFDLD